MKIEKIHSTNPVQTKHEKSLYTPLESQRAEAKNFSTPRASFRKFKSQQCEAVKLAVLQKHEVSATLNNTTDTEVRISISEILTNRPPYLYSPLKEIILAPGQSSTINLQFEDKKDLNRFILIETEGGKGYGMNGSAMTLDLSKTKSLEIDLVADWIYPGEDFWYIDPFRVIYANARN